ncbi:hypothetical protein BDZ89DRAFT_1066462, partial [Hymenopellis radicata]
MDSSNHLFPRQVLDSDGRTASSLQGTATEIPMMISGRDVLKSDSPRSRRDRTRGEFTIMRSGTLDSPSAATVSRCVGVSIELLISTRTTETRGCRRRVSNKRRYN